MVSTVPAVPHRGLIVVKMEPLQDEVFKLASERRKRRKKDDYLSLERDLEQEVLLLKTSRRRNQAAPYSGGIVEPTHTESEIIFFACLVEWQYTVSFVWSFH